MPAVPAARVRKPGRATRPGAQRPCPRADTMAPAVHTSDPPRMTTPATSVDAPWMRVEANGTKVSQPKKAMLTHSRAATAAGMPGCGLQRALGQQAHEGGPGEDPARAQQADGDGQRRRLEPSEDQARCPRPGERPWAIAAGATRCSLGRARARQGPSGQREQHRDQREQAEEDPAPAQLLGDPPGGHRGDEARYHPGRRQQGEQAGLVRGGPGATDARRRRRWPRRPSPRLAGRVR